MSILLMQRQGIILKKPLSKRRRIGVNKLSDVVGIYIAKVYYANYLTGFSHVVFTIKNVFGMGNKLVKHWNVKGIHAGILFGIPETN